MQSSVNKGSGFSAKVLMIVECLIHVSYTPEASLNCEVYNLDSETVGFVHAIESTHIEVILIKDCKIEISDILYISLNPISICFNNNVLGSVITPLGENITHFTIKENFYNQHSVPIFYNAPNINERTSINNQFLTGNNIIDILFPIGYGQRMMIIGDSKVYKTGCTIQIIKTVLMNRKSIKRDEKTIFIYVSIGQTLNHLKEVLNFLVNNVIGNTLIVNSQCNDTLGMQMLTPYSAMAVANHYANQGYNIIIIMDDLTKHAICNRELMLLAKKPYGRDYYPSDIFYKHSSLLERSFSGPKGSITTLAITETIEEELTNYIVTNIISITDGQLFFTKDLLNQEYLPPISTQYSVSRVGFLAQSKILNKIATQCNISLANYYNNLDFYNMYRDNCDNSVKHDIYTGLYILNILYIYKNITIDYIKQIITVAIIDKKVSYNDYNLNTINQKIFTDRMRQIIEASYDLIIKNDTIMNKIYTDINDISILEGVTELIYKAKSDLK